MTQVLVAGSSNTDFVFGCERLPEPGETLSSSTFEIVAGGKGANQAVAASRAGASVAFVGCFGDDQYGQERRADLAADNVGLEFSNTASGVPSGLAFIMVDSQGENSIVTYDGANASLSGDDIIGAIHDLTPDFVVLTLEPPREVVDAALRAAKAIGACTVVTAAPYSDYVRDLTATIDVLIANQIEAARILGGEQDSISSEESALKLAQQHDCQVVITLGANGAIFADATSAGSVPAIPVTVVDSTGAGDALTGAMVAWLARGAPFDAAVRAGVAAGSLAASKRGAQSSLPRKDQILEALQ